MGADQEDNFTINHLRKRLLTITARYEEELLAKDLRIHALNLQNQALSKEINDLREKENAPDPD